MRKTKSREAGHALAAPALLMALALPRAGGAPAVNAAEPPRDPPKAIPGRFVDIGGYRLHIRCSGKGRPAVVLLSGLGDTAEIWDRVQPEVAKFARVCSYDRAGEGKSDPSPARGTLQQSVNELHRLLLKVRIAGPYVLVGASWGGLIARVYANQHPERVAGMVLVDSAHEDAILNINGKIVRPRTMPLEEWRALVPRPPEAERRSGDVREDLNLVYDTRESREHPLGDLPLIVLTRGAGHYPQQRDSPFTPEQRDADRKRLQADLARLSRSGRQIVVAESGHRIHRDAPEAVIDAIREVVTTVRQGRRAGE